MNPDLFATDGGIRFGYAVDVPRFPLPEGLENNPLCYTGDRHILTYAPSGSGKSRRLLLSNIIQLPNWSLLILDVKGELAQLTRRYRKDVARNDVALFNPFKILGMPSNGFNPVAALAPKSDSFVDDAMGLAEALIKPDGRDEHWVLSAQDLLCGLIMYSRIRGTDGGSLGHVRELLGVSAEEFVVNVEAMTVAGFDDGIDAIGIKVARFNDLKSGNRELMSIISTAAAQTRWIDSKPMQADLAAGAFDFSRMKQKPTTVYVNLPADKLTSHSSYVRLILTSFFQSIYRDRAGSKTPILLMADETAVIGELPIFRDAIPLVRTYGVKIWQLFQDVPQHKAIFGERYESAIANSGVLQGFAANDIRTAKTFSEHSGQQTAPVLGLTAPAAAFAGKPAAATIGLSFAPVPTLLPQDVMNSHMDEGFSVLFSHRTKGRVFSYIPEPSEVPAYAGILSRA